VFVVNLEVKHQQYFLDAPRFLGQNLAMTKFNLFLSCLILSLALVAGDARGEDVKVAVTDVSKPDISKDVSDVVVKERVAALLVILPDLLELMGVPREVKLPDSHPVMVRARAVATALARVEDDAKWRAIAFVYAGAEGGFHASPPGFNDAGKACGILQLHAADAKAILEPGMTCEAIRKDLSMGLRAGLLVMKSLVKDCGSMAGALTAYGTNGQCPKNWTLPLVIKRMKIAKLYKAAT
jgi:hypothetical protein